MYQALSERKSEEKAEHIIVFFYDEYGFQTHPASKYLLEAQNHHATFVFMADKKGDIPTGCSQHIYVDSRSTGYIVNTSDKSESVQFYYRPISEQKLEHLVTVLAPVYTEELSLESSLTKSISLFELLNIVAADDLNLQSRWNTSKVYESMSAPIGVTRSGVIYLDLHDKAHGPHGLVAGTTGSGKSELLQTYILSIATYYHPYEVGFVIIDFKGGGMVNQFKDLPHLLGAITNIDGKEIDRSLRFIKAELKKRQRLFAEANVNHIDKYIKLYKSGSVDIPLPHLILIVDEFAELKADQPEFMQELISAARIGRSLGVHLILATQKPSGQVDDQIWSNSKFKLCLKVQNQEDSNEVLKSPLAAEIKEPGRAYLQVGNNEIFELLQSAYSGAPERTGDTSTKEFSIYEVTQSGRRRNVFTQKRNIVGDSDRTQLDAIVDYVRDFFENSGQLRLPGICLPPLERVIAHPGNALSGDLVDIGIYDDPDNQYQGKTYLDFDNKNTFILGSSQYGKTNLLISVIRSIASAKGPDQNIFYILDFGSMILKNFENMKHVGGVVCSSEDEKLKNLLKMLFEEINNRKEKLLSAGVGSFASYIEAGYTDLPHIYLVVDNMTAAMELYFEEDESLLTLIREGLAVGISTIVANVQTAGISYRYMSNFANRVAFYCNDSSEYMSLFDHSTVCPDELPGRCLIEIDKRIYECQTYIAFAGEKEIDRISAIREFVSLINAQYATISARKIPSIPAVLSAEMLRTEYKTSVCEYKLPLGLSYEDVSPIIMDVAQLGIMGLCGGESDQRRNFVDYLLSSFEAKAIEYPLKTVIIDDVSKEYAEYQDNPSVTQYTLDVDIVQGLLEQWYEELEGRYAHLLSGEDIAEKENLLLLIVNNNDVAKRIEDDFELNEKFGEIVTRFKKMKVAIIFANYQNVNIPYDAPAPLIRIKEEQHLLFFESLDSLKPFDAPYEIVKKNRRRLETGDAFYIRDNTFTKLKLITCERV